MAMFVQSTEKQKRLVLPATPLGFQIDDQGNHGSPGKRNFFSAFTKALSFEDCKRTPGAAICERAASR